MSAQRRPVRRQPGPRHQPGEHRAKLSRLDLADQPERLDPAADPHTRRLARTRVVLVEATRHLRQVVRLGTDPELPHGLHIDTCLSKRDFVTRSDPNSR